MTKNHFDNSQTGPGTTQNDFEKAEIRSEKAENGSEKANNRSATSQIRSQSAESVKMKAL
jgi:hypothetical protein